MIGHNNMTIGKNQMTDDLKDRVELAIKLLNPICINKPDSESRLNITDEQVDFLRHTLEALKKENQALKAHIKEIDAVRRGMANSIKVSRQALAYWGDLSIQQVLDDTALSLFATVEEAEREKAKKKEWIKKSTARRQEKTVGDNLSPVETENNHD